MNSKIIAEQAYAKNTIEGYLAALLIYQQFSQEVIHLLLEEAHFLLQLRIFPNEILFPPKKRSTFGQVIEEIKITISFINKNEIIKQCDLLENNYRNEFVHGLTKDASLVNIEEKIRHVKELNTNILKLSLVSMPGFHGRT